MCVEEVKCSWLHLDCMKWIFLCKLKICLILCLWRRRSDELWMLLLCLSSKYFIIYGILYRLMWNWNEFSNMWDSRKVEQMSQPAWCEYIRHCSSELVFVSLTESTCSRLPPRSLRSVFPALEIGAAVYFAAFKPLNRAISGDTGSCVGPNRFNSLQVVNHLLFK